MDSERAFVAALVGLALAVSALVVRPFFTFVALAAFLAYALFPLQRWLAPRLESRLGPRLGRRVSALVLMVVAAVLFVLPFVLLVQVVVRQALAVAEAVQSGAVDLGVLRDLVGPGVERTLAEFARAAAGRIAEETPGLLGGASNVAVGVTVFGFALYSLLVGGESVVAWLREVTPLPRRVEDELLAELDRLTYAVLVTQGLIAVVQAVLTGAALLVLGFSNVLFWTVLAVVFGLLPFVGSMFIWLPAAVFLLATGDLLGGAALLVYGFGLVNLTDNYLRPVVGGRSANLDPTVLVVGIFGGLAAFGFAGIFVGPIVLGFTRSLVDVAAREYA
ncbi:AI-2E family transporter [Halorussus salilacus]|uniref:AI-2E family transporter n=1 Tax=Halorussus salilacus TaxID=2953750 RepID=UPI0020A17715|nr:AI-2E family transporter [Halorussus salilacus]USZ69347.1 AI-2E family transporter [Halorussus salilacus]